MAICNGCGLEFSSRNAVFKHLKETNGACLSKEDYKNFVRYVRKSVKPPKVVLLYGYLPYSGPSEIRNGDDAGAILLQTIEELQNEIDGFSDDEESANANANSEGDGETNNQSSSKNKINRSYGFTSRSAECVQQDLDTGAVAEVMAVRLYPIRADMSIEDWLDQIQKKLDTRFAQERKSFTSDIETYNTTPIRILGRQDMPNMKFNAETDVSELVSGRT